MQNSQISSDFPAGRGDSCLLVPSRPVFSLRLPVPALLALGAAEPQFNGLWRGDGALSPGEAPEVDCWAK